VRTARRGRAGSTTTPRRPARARRRRPTRTAPAATPTASSASTASVRAGPRRRAAPPQRSWSFLREGRGSKPHRAELSELSGCHGADVSRSACLTGARLPVLLVSPWVEKGTVIGKAADTSGPGEPTTEYDGASIIWHNDTSCLMVSLCQVRRHLHHRDGQEALRPAQLPHPPVRAGRAAPAQRPAASFCARPWSPGSDAIAPAQRRLVRHLRGAAACPRPPSRDG
jgi:hypothetical protein